MKCLVVFCHSTLAEEIRRALDDAGCRHYVGVNRVFARDDDERRLDSRYHPGADTALLAFMDADRVDAVAVAVKEMSAREHATHTRVAILPVESFL